VNHSYTLKELYAKLVDQTIDEQELLWLKKYFNTGNPEEMYRLIRSEFELPDQMNIPTPKEQEVLARVYQSIAQQRFREALVVAKIPKARLWLRIAVAAAIIAVIFSAGLWYFGNTLKVEKNINYVNDIAPGKNGATLTLANGRKILINDALTGNIANESGVKISKTKEGQIIYEITNNEIGILSYNTLSTTRGEQTQVRLPDGTIVFLNAESSLRYPTSFTNIKNREVELKGEGFFSVSKDKLHPFIVHSKGQKVEVLGTQFNINGYNTSNAVMTTLVEGSVKVSGVVSKEMAMLKPGQQSSFKNGSLTIKEVLIDDAVAWKDGYFYFSGELQTILQDIGRWYDVKIQYDTNSHVHVRLDGHVSRQLTLNKLLKYLGEATGGVQFELQIVQGERRIIVK